MLGRVIVFDGGLMPNRPSKVVPVNAWPISHSSLLSVMPVPAVWVPLNKNTRWVDASTGGTDASDVNGLLKRPSFVPAAPGCTNQMTGPWKVMVIVAAAEVAVPGFPLSVIV